MRDFSYASATRDPLGASAMRAIFSDGARRAPSWVSARRAPLFRHAAALCFAAVLSLGVAHADTRTFQGFALELMLNTDADVTIESDPGLTGAVRVVGDSLDCLGTNSGPGVQISTSACGSDMGHLAIMVPRSMPLSLEVAGSGNVSVGDLDAPLKAVLSSGGDLKVRRATVFQLEARGSGDATVQAVDGPADIAINGSGDVRLMRVSGPLKFRQNGSGDLAVVQIDGPVADIESHGSGDALMLHGHVGVLHAITHGNGDVVMGGTAGTADLEASGGGDIALARADGVVTRHASDDSTINVGGPSEIAASALAKLRASLAGGGDGDDDTDSSSHVVTHHHSSGFHDFLAGIVVLGVIFWGWRIISRNGGFGRVGRAFSRSGAANGTPAAPRDPGVIALCDLLAALERRLARVETHVTSREFDLNRKFREIDAGH
jgi:hypothetical protein